MRSSRPPDDLTATIAQVDAGSEDPGLVEV
jgi:hypothetical protein